MTTNQQREAVARALWDFDQDGTTPVWRDMAWADMGGSEPDEERVRYEMRADAALAALAPVQPDPLRAGVEALLVEVTPVFGDSHHIPSRLRALLNGEHDA